MRLAAAALLIFATLPAAASRLDYVAKVTTNDRGMSRIRPVGDPRYIALATMSADDEITLLDIQTATTIIVKPRGLERLANANSVEAEVVWYTPERAGIHVTDGSSLQRAAHHWYVEIDPRTGKKLRSTSLGNFSERVELEVVGTDAANGNVWFAETRYDEDLATDFSHVHGPKELVLRRLELSSLAVEDAMSLALPARENKSGYEDRLSYHHAADFSRFAVVEYDERSFHTKPPAQVYFLDPGANTAFSVPALPTTYGVAFTDRFIYLASAQAGTIARVHIAKHKIDKTARGPMLTHDLVVAKDKLLVIGTSKKFTVCTLELACTARPHAPELAAAYGELFGSGSPSVDGRFYVLPQALPSSADAVNAMTSRDVLIARVVD